MPSLCLTILAHLPSQLRHYSFFDIGESSAYEDNVHSFERLEQAVADCILPANRILLRRLGEYRGDFRIAVALSGILMDELERFRPDVLDSFKALADTGHVEFIAQPHYHSLSSIASLQEFREQTVLHQGRIKTLFGQTASAFMNTGMIHSNEIALEIEAQGYSVALVGGGSHLLGKRSPNHLYRPACCQKLKLLVNNDPMSDDVTLRFTNRDWPDYPLSPTQYTHWVEQAQAKGEILNLTVDLMRFTGENRTGTGLCEFLDQFPSMALLHKKSRFETPTQVAQSLVRAAPIATPVATSGVAPAHDLTPWMGNDMQKDALGALYLLESKIKGAHNPALLRTWRILQISDHFLYMSTRDGAPPVANPYGSPYDAYINFMNVLTDFAEHISG